MSDSEKDRHLFAAADAAFGAAARIAIERGLSQSLATWQFPEDAREQLLAEWVVIAGDYGITLERLREITLDNHN